MKLAGSSWFTRPAIIAVGVALLAGLGAGVAIGVAAQPDPTTSIEYAELNDRFEQIKTNNASMQDELSDTESDLNQSKIDAVDAKAELDARKQELDSRESSLDQRETNLADRETKVSSSEQQAAANTFGNGLKIVGQNVTAGSYATEGASGSGCYYAWKTGTGSDSDIVDNNIVEGSATVTLVDGEVFESSGCKPWKKTP